VEHLGKIDFSIAQKFNKFMLYLNYNFQPQINLGQL